MQIRHKARRRRVKAKPPDDHVEAVGPNEVWAMNVVHDPLAAGREQRVLTMVEALLRYVPVRDARDSSRGDDVVLPSERVRRTAR